MRPAHIFVLLLSGALGGALIMRVAHPEDAAIPVVVAQSKLQPPATAPPEEPAVQGPPAVEPLAEPLPAKPSPMPPPAPIRQPVSSAVVSPRQPVRREITVVYPFRNVPPLAPEPVSNTTSDPPSPTPAPPPVSTDPQPEPAAPAPPEVTAAPVPQPHQVTLNAGLALPVRLVDGLSSERNVPGDTFVATLDKEVVADGFVIAERGARVEGRVVAVDRAKVRSAALALELTKLHTSDGQTVPIRTEGFFQHANPGEVSNQGKIAGGVILGAAIGAIAGGGKGAAIGAGIGGGAGVGDVLLTSRPAVLASEALVMFRLKNSVPLTEQLH